MLTRLPRATASHSSNSAGDRARRRGLAATMALMALSVGVYSTIEVGPAAASTDPTITAPERVYPKVGETITFGNTVDPISDDNRTISVDATDGPTCQSDPSKDLFDIGECTRV